MIATSFSGKWDCQARRAAGHGGLSGPGGCQARGVVGRRWLHASSEEHVKVRRVVRCGGFLCETVVGNMGCLVVVVNSHKFFWVEPVAVRLGRSLAPGKEVNFFSLYGI